MDESSPLVPPAPLDAIASERARRVRMVLTDVDGVLTSAHVIYDGQGSRLRAFSTRDGSAIQWLAQCEIPVGFISGLDDPGTRKRAEDLGVEEVHLGSQDKLSTIHSILERRGLRSEEVAYFGDDLIDLPGIHEVGFSACPSDAAAEVQAACAVVLPQRGGEGFFRAAAECILKAQGRWEAVLARYLVCRR